MKRWGLLMVGILLAAGGAAEAQNPKLVIATGGIGGVYYYYGTQVSEIVNKAGFAAATAMQTAASVDNMMLIRDKTEPDKKTWFIATVLPDTAYFTTTGKHEKFKDKPVKAAILWMMYPNFLHLVTTDKSGVGKLADLQNKRVSTGAPGSGTEFTALNLVRAAGLEPTKFKKWEKLGAKESEEALANGTIDAFFWSGGLPTGSLVELANTLGRKGLKMTLIAMPENDPGVKKFKDEFRGLADSLPIPKEIYGTAADTPTLAFWNMFVAPESLPADLAYKLVKSVFENLDSLRAAVKAARDTNPESTAKFIGKSAIPFHPGAVQYFKERGLVK